MKKANLYFIFILVVISSFVGGYFVGNRGYSISFKNNEIVLDVKSDKPDYTVDADFTTFWKVFKDINEKHLSKPLDGQKLVWGATKGLVKALDDPYSLYLSPDENTSSDEVLSGEYQGIGAELVMKDELVTVVSPFDGSPAKAADIRPNDRIIEVNHEDILGQNLADVVKKIKGPKGSEVVLKIVREGAKEPFEVTIVRDTIEIKTVTLKGLSEFEKLPDELKSRTDIAYIRISRFGEKTNTEWDAAVRDMQVKFPNNKSIILDLRSNPGGFLDSAVHLASDFISNGVVVKEELSDGSSRSINVDHSPLLLNKPLYILVDGGSASASEILSGALRERAGAKIYGVKSFGKGTIQQPIDYPDGSGLNVTIGKWLTPEGYWVHKVGIEPDVEIKLTEEDIQNKHDRQLEELVKAIPQ